MRGAVEADETVDMKCDRGGKTQAFRVDLAESTTIERAFKAAEAQLGPLRAMVANAGILGDRTRIDEQTAAGLHRLFSVNVIGTIICAQQAVLRMSTRHGGLGGSIVMLSSVEARLGGLGGLVPYAATKGAIETLTRGLAIEVAKEGVRVNAVAPGIVETAMTTPDAREIAEKAVPMGRVGDVVEIAEAVSWLLSPASSFVTGTILTVSGGR